MSDSNVIWVDFRLSKDIRSRQVISFAERMRESSLRTQHNIQQSKMNLDRILQMLEEKR